MASGSSSDVHTVPTGSISFTVDRDYRPLRLLGQDDQLQGRANSGFVEADEDRWTAWREADLNALTEPDQ